MWRLADLWTACIVAVVRAGVKAISLLVSGLGGHVLLLIKALAAFSMRLDSLLKGLMWRLMMAHAPYMVALLLLYILCPSLLKLMFKVKEYLTLMLLEGLRALLTPCFGELPPLFYTAARLAIDLLSGTTWLDLLFQHALSSN